MPVKIKENSKNVAKVKKLISLILCQFEGLSKGGSALRTNLFVLAKKSVNT